MIAAIIISIVIGLIAVGLGANLWFTPKIRREQTDPENRVRRVIRENLPTTAAADATAVSAYKKILAAPTFPSAGLIDSMTEAEMNAYAELGTDRTLVLAYATHPHRRNAILNLIAACEDEYLVIVGEYAQGLTPRHGVVMKDFAAARYAAYIFDGMLLRNPRFLRLSRDKVGLTVGTMRFQLPTVPLTPIATDRYFLSISPSGKGFCLDTTDRSKLVFLPEGDLVAVSCKSGAVLLKTTLGTTVLHVKGTRVTARPVYCGRLGVRIASKTAMTVTMGTLSMQEIRAEHEAFLTTQTIVDFQADAVTESLKKTFATVMQEVLRYRRAHVIESAFAAAAVTAGSFDNVPLTSLAVPEEEFLLSAAIVLAAKSYRGRVLSEPERQTLRKAAIDAQHGAPLYRACVFKLLGLLQDEDRDAVGRIFITLATDAVSFLRLVEELEEPERSLAAALFTGSCLPNLAKLVEALPRTSDLGLVAAYLLLRTRLLGVRLYRGALFCAPTLPTLKSMTVLGQKLDVKHGNETAIEINGMRLYTTVVPRGNDVKLITTA